MSKGKCQEIVERRLARRNGRICRIAVVAMALAATGCSRQGAEVTQPGGKTVQGVSKVIVAVEKNGIPHYLLSRKNAPGDDKHGRLELAGGHIENETPAAAAARELAEEEKTGRLATLFSGTESSERAVVDGDEHYIFRLAISHEDYLRLAADPRESLGFELVPAASLDDESTRRLLTGRTRRIFKVLRREP